MWLAHVVELLCVELHQFAIKVVSYCKVKVSLYGRGRGGDILKDLAVL